MPKQDTELEKLIYELRRSINLYGKEQIDAEEFLQALEIINKSIKESKAWNKIQS